MYDILIVGAGPAGLTAGIYAVRRAMKCIVFADIGSLSTVTEATIVDDYPGIPNIKGMDLYNKFLNHAKSLGVEIRNEKILSLGRARKHFVVKTEKDKYNTKTIILATGSRHRKASVPGEEKFAGKGVSYCASCDGPLYKGKKTLVVGGGDTAVTYAILLDQIGADTTLIHRRDELRAAETFQKQIKKSGVKIIWNTVLKGIQGDRFVKSVTIEDVKTKKTQKLLMDGVFIAIGTIPMSEFAKEIGIKTDEKGFIIVDKYQATNVKGVFAAGDCCNNPFKRITSAIGDGSVAAEAAYSYLKEME